MNDIVNILGSSSDGNCYIYNQDIMVDLGINYSKIKQYSKNIKIILLTHHHLDHFNPYVIKKMAYYRPNCIWICGNWLVNDLVKLGVNKKKIFIVEPNRKYDLGKYIIEPVEAIHDIPNLGYKMTIKKDDYKIFHITDTSEIEHIKAQNFNLYCIEANYDDEEIQERIKKKEANGEFIIEYRVMNSHLSKNQANNWLIENMGNNSQFIYCHQHIDKSNYNYEEGENKNV